MHVWPSYKYFYVRILFNVITKLLHIVYALCCEWFSYFGSWLNYSNWWKDWPIFMAFSIILIILAFLGGNQFVFGFADPYSHRITSIGIKTCSNLRLYIFNSCFYFTLIFLILCVLVSTSFFFFKALLKRASKA
jgi:hypothetical protein